MKIEAGRYYRTRDGQKVGPIEHSRESGTFVWREKRKTCGRWNDDGLDGFDTGPVNPEDLIAEWRDEPDLTAITTPYGLLDRKTREALKAHGGPYEFCNNVTDWEWTDVVPPSLWRNGNVYRVKPAPPKPREMTAVWNAGRSCFEIHVTNVRIPNLTPMTVTGVIPNDQP